MLEWCNLRQWGYHYPRKKRWFVIVIFFDGLDWKYHTKNILPQRILPYLLPDNDKDGNMYNISRKELS